jgi:hypothetical protein
LIQDRLILARVLRQLALKAGKVLVRHPTPEALIAYEAGDLPPNDARQIGEHFVHCRECPELLLDYRRFIASSAGKGSLEPDVATAWLKLRRRVTRERSPGRLRRRAPWIVRASCLLLLAALTVLSFWVQRLRHEVRRLGEPQVNLPVESLAPPAQKEGWVRRIAVPAGAERFLVTITPPEGPPAAVYRLEIRTSDGRFLWSADRLARGVDGSFAVGLSRRFLPGGEYRIRLLGNVEGRMALVEEFPILLLYTPAKMPAR